MTSAIVIVLIPSNDAIVATRIGHDFTISTMVFVGFLALTIERSDRFLVLR